MKINWETKLLLIFLIFLIGSGGLGILAAEYIDKITMQEIRAFRKFVNDPQNDGQYINDFDTDIWYDIDGKNPNVPPLTIEQVSIENIGNRIIGKSIHSKIADRLFDVFLNTRKDGSDWREVKK